jgi:hypothetical protein
MNRAFQVVIGVSVILLLIMLAIFFKGSTVTEPQVASVPPTAGKSPGKPEAKPKSKGQLERRHKAAQEAEPDIIETSGLPVIKVKVETPPPPFPAASDVKAGMSREEMISKFGNPRVAASWAEHGSLAEKFIYTRDAQVTAVMLLDGEVVRSRTGSSHQPMGLRRAGSKENGGPGGAEIWNGGAKTR